MAVPVERTFAVKVNGTAYDVKFEPAHTVDLAQFDHSVDNPKFVVSVSGLPGVEYFGAKTYREGVIKAERAIETALRGAANQQPLEQGEEVESIIDEVRGKGQEQQPIGDPPDDDLGIGDPDPDDPEGDDDPDDDDDDDDDDEEPDEDVV